MSYYHFPDSFENKIIAAIQNNVEVFCFLNTGWNLKTNKNHLIAVLNTSLRQIYNNLYYGKHTVTEIQNAIKHLQNQN